MHAINGLAALGDVAPTRVVPQLAAQYTRDSLSIEMRLNIGQAMLLVASRCGSTLPKHARPFMNAFLHTAANSQLQDEIMLSSALSNLSTMVEHLGAATSFYLGDLMECTAAILLPTVPAEAQRAAVRLCNRLIKVLGDQSVEHFAEQMQIIYKHLKVLVDATDDELTRVHAMAAFGELDTIMRKFIFPAQRGCVYNINTSKFQ